MAKDAEAARTCQKGKVKVQFLGAAREVTGSLTYFEAETKYGMVRFLVDCGLSQKNGNNYEGKLQMYNSKLPVAAENIDFIILTHAHIDHSGLVPFLGKKGFTGKVYATKGTAELCSILWPDSAHIQEEDCSQYNRKLLRRSPQGSRRQVEPLYTDDDAVRSLSLLKGIRYNKLVDLENGIRFRFKNAGHIFGSAVIEIWIQDSEGRELKVVVSGDIGNQVRARLDAADFLIMESTYGSRVHEIIDIDQRNLLLAKTILETCKNGGRVIIPSFTVERLQTLIYAINEGIRKLPEDEAEMLKSAGIVIDSPMGVAVTKIFQDAFWKKPKRFKYLLGKNLDYYVQNCTSPFELKNLKVTSSQEESQALNDSKDCMAIISANGMCSAGRIRHHLKHNLWRPECTVVFVGFQAEGTLGRRILNGEKMVKIFGEEIAVNAKIVNIPEFSSHADCKGLIRFVKKFKTPPKCLFLIHGELEAMEPFKKDVEKLGIHVAVPHLKEVYELSDTDGNSLGTDSGVHPFTRDVSVRVNEAIVSLSKLRACLSEASENRNLLDEISNLPQQEREMISDLKTELFGSASKLKKSFYQIIKSCRKNGKSKRS